MPQHNALHCDSGRRNGRPAAQARDESEDETPYATQVITATTPHTATLKFLGEHGAMPLFVTTKFSKLTPKGGIAKPTGSQLSSIDVYSAVFTSVIYFQDAIAKRFPYRYWTCGLHASNVSVEPTAADNPATGSYNDSLRSRRASSPPRAAPTHVDDNTRIDSEFEA